MECVYCAVRTGYLNEFQVSCGQRIYSGFFYRVWYEFVPFEGHPNVTLRVSYKP
jgi:hypothetical protein